MRFATAIKGPVPQGFSRLLSGTAIGNCFHRGRGSALNRKQKVHWWRLKCASDSTQDSHLKQAYIWTERWKGLKEIHASELRHQNSQQARGNRCEANATSLRAGGMQIPFSRFSSRVYSTPFQRKKKSRCRQIGTNESWTHIKEY